MAKESESQENIEAAERIQRQRLAMAQYLYRRGKDIERWHAKKGEDPSQREIALTPMDPEDTEQWCVTTHPCGSLKLQNCSQSPHHLSLNPSHGDRDRDRNRGKDQEG